LLSRLRMFDFYAAVLIVSVPVVESITSKLLPIIISEVMLPIPLFFTIGSQVRYREWFSVSGVTVFLFAYYAAIAEHLYGHFGVAVF
jgi:hypothetical protein